MSQPKIRGIRSIHSLLTEDAILTLSVYAMFALYCLGVISFLPLAAFVIVYVIRVFNLRHERAHLPLKNASHKIQWISELLEVYHTPYQEPFSEKRQKHLAHHRAHMPSSKQQTPKDAHSLLEGSLASALFSALFYHEVMFVLDVLRDRKISRARMQSILISSAAIAVTIYLAGIENYLAFYLAYRIGSFIAWFTFSYLLHLEAAYEGNIGERLPNFFKWATERVLGLGSVTAIFYHKFHHTRPSHFYEF